MSLDGLDSRPCLEPQSLGRDRSRACNSPLSQFTLRTDILRTLTKILAITLLLALGAPVFAESASKYTCVMHPEVIQDTPGKCPKCGMTLVLKKQKDEHPLAAPDARSHGDADAFIHRYCRSDVAREFWDGMGAGLDTDVRQNVHVRRRHAHAARRRVSALHQREHAAR